MAEVAGHREAVGRMTKQLVDSGVPEPEARKLATRAAQRKISPRAAARDAHINERNVLRNTSKR